MVAITGFRITIWMRLKMKTIITFLLLLFSLSCSTTNIDLETNDFEWKHEFDFYIDYHDGLLIDEDTLLVTHYTSDYNIRNESYTMYENIYKFDRGTGEKLEHIFTKDSLTSRDIIWSEKYLKFANRMTWPKEFNMESNYDIIIDIDKFTLLHYTTRSYTLEITKDGQTYYINLDELGEIRIEYFLKFSNELYLWIHSDNYDYKRVGSFLYKLNIDDLIRKYQ